MSDYGSRGYGSGSEEQGWDNAGRSRGFGDGYDDYAPQQRGPVSGGGYGDYAQSDPYQQGGSDPYTVRNPSPHDEPATSGRARVPGADSTGPGRARGSARVGGKRPTGLSEEESEDMKKAKKKKKRRRRLIALACVLVMFLGIGTVVGTLFFENVPLPKDIIEKELDRNTTISYAGGKEEMGRIGTEQGNRSLVNVYEGNRKAKKDNDVPPAVKHALLAMEDRKFYEHDGIDFWGVMRALVNNVTGGSRQGASTLTQQYVGTVSQIRGDDTGYYTKAKEAVMAMKMDDEYTKDEIIEHYLNLVYMGRGSYGLGAAVKAWYGKDQKVKDLTASQAAVIFAQVKAPDGSFDPMQAGNDKGLKERWEYALKGMVSKGWMEKSEQKKFLEKGLPKTEKIKGLTASAGADEPTGFVSHGQIIDEAKENYGLDEQDIRTNGYKIETTINKDLQKIAEGVASHKNGSVMEKQNDNLRAALVAINPKNGEVVAYYGGSDDGTTVDKARAVHAPGSEFKEVTISAAIEEGWGPESRWDGSSPRKFEERHNGELRNSGEGNGANEPNITLRKATEMSLNTPMYSIATKVGANKIVQLAQKMGVEKMQVPDDENEGEHKTYRLGDKKVQEMLKDNDNPRKFADNEVSFGQFPVSVVDMASVNATLAAEGVHHETHFIKKITDAEGEEVAMTGDLKEEIAVKTDVARDVTDILTGVHPKSMGGNTFPTNNQQFAAKSGTWERECEDCDENASITFGGYVPELASSAWVGDKENENGSVEEVGGAPAYGAGISGEVWKEFMQQAVQVSGFDAKGTFTKGPGGTGSKPSEVGGGEGDEGDEGDNGDDVDCEETPDDPACGGATTPDCTVEPQHPQCGGSTTPDCELNPTDPACQSQDECQQPFPPPHCEEAADRVRAAGNYSANDSGSANRYAVREDYRQY